MKIHLHVLVLGATLAAASPALGAFTCETVARRGDTDPNGDFFAKVFHPAVAVNQDGDTLFSARPAGVPTSLYFYSGDGATKTVLATAKGMAPGGFVYKGSKPFTELGINSFDDKVFRATLVGGLQGVFGTLGGGAVKKLAVTGDASPCGSTFTGFPAVSARVATAAAAAYVGAAADGTTGAVVYNLLTDATICAIDEGDVIDGREVCEILDISMQNNAFVAIRAITKVDCSNGLEDPLETILSETDVLALEGDATPIAGTTYAGFSREPSYLGTDVAFLASVTGAVSLNAVVVVPDTGGAGTVAIAEKDAAPDVGGFFKRINQLYLTSAGVFVNAKLKKTTTKAKKGILSATEAALVTSSAPPAPFAATKYKSFQNTSSMSDDGADLAVVVTVRDNLPPKAQAGVVRCED